MIEKQEKIKIGNRYRFIEFLDKNFKIIVMNML